MEKFLWLNCFLIGYDLEYVYDEVNESIDVSCLIVGLEGFLVMVVEVKFFLILIVMYKVLVNIKYDFFELVLCYVFVMVVVNVILVEMVDLKVFNLVKIDIIWYFIVDFIIDIFNKDMLGFNMVEYNSNDEGEIKVWIVELEVRLIKVVEIGEGGVIGY